MKKYILSLALVLAAVSSFGVVSYHGRFFDTNGVEITPTPDGIVTNGQTNVSLGTMFNVNGVSSSVTESMSQNFGGSGSTNFTTLTGAGLRFYKPDGTPTTINASFEGDGSGLTNLPTTPGAVTNGSPQFALSSVEANLANQDASGYWDGWNSWGGNGSAVTEAIISNTVVQMKASGIDKLGFNLIGIDDGMFTNRDAAGIPMIDGTKFPSGFPWLCNFIHTNGFRIGVYGNPTNHVGLAGGNNVYYFFGKEAEGAAYFLTNHVDYFKFDSPPGLGTNYPGERDYVTGFDIAPIYNQWDESFLKFVSAVKAGGYPVAFEGSIGVDTKGRMGQNIPMLLNYWRPQSIATNDALGLTVFGDALGAQGPLLLWSWMDVGARAMPHTMRDNFNICMGAPDGSIQATLTRNLYMQAFLGANLQIIGTSLVCQGASHDFSSDVANPLFRQIRARKTVPHEAYYTNGCQIWTKDNKTGGLDVLVLNRNYNEAIGGDGAHSEVTSDRWGQLGFTNQFSVSGTNYYYSFYWTNATIAPSRMGLSATKFVLTDASTGAKVFFTNSVNVDIFAASARLFTLQPVDVFPAADGIDSDGSVSLLDVPYFHFWTTNSGGPNPPTYGTFQGGVPSMGGSVRGIQIEGNSKTTWGINGADKFVMRFGVVDGYLYGAGSQITVFTNGGVAWISPVASTGYTNLTLTLDSSIQTISLYCSNRCFVGNPALVKTANAVERYFTTATNIIGVTNLYQTFTNNTLAPTFTEGTWLFRGMLDYKNDGSGGINSSSLYPASGVNSISGWIHRWSGDSGSPSFVMYMLPTSDRKFSYAYTTGTAVGAVSEFEGIISCSGTVTIPLSISANSLVPTNPPYITTNSFIYIKKLP